MTLVSSVVAQVQKLTVEHLESCVELAGTRPEGASDTVWIPYCQEGQKRSNSG